MIKFKKLDVRLKTRSDRIQETGMTVLKITYHGIGVLN